MDDTQLQLVRILGQDAYLLAQLLNQSMGEHGLTFGTDLCNAFVGCDDGIYVKTLLLLSLQNEMQRVKESPNAVYTLFRSNSTPVAAIKQFMQIFGTAYLKTLNSVMQQTIQQGQPLQWAQALVNYVLDSLQYIPISVRTLFGMIAQQIQAADLSDHRDVIFGSLFFFRFVIPHLLSSLGDSSSDQSRNLIEMAKIITALTNFNSSTNGDINHFISFNTARLSQFYEQLPLFDAPLLIFSESLEFQKEARTFLSFFVTALESFLQEHEGQDSEKGEYYMSLMVQLKQYVPETALSPRPPPKRKSSLSMMKDRLKQSLRRIRSDSPQK